MALTPDGATPDIASMDERCLDFDHSFPWMDAYDEDREAIAYEQQLAMRCSRCGETMQHSLQRMMAELRNLVDSPGPT